MNFPKLFILAITAFGLASTLAQAKCCDHKHARNLAEPIVQIATFPFKAGSFVLREVALPIIELPINLAKKAFDKQA